MKIKIVYFSLEGNTRYIVKSLNNAIKSDVVELVPKKQLHDKGAAKFFFGGMTVVFKGKPELECYDKTLNYDLIVIATPIWAGTFSPPIRTFLSENNLNGKNAAIIACHGGGGIGKCEREIKSIYPKCNIVGTLDFKNPAGNDSENAKIKAIEWLTGLIAE